MNLLGSRGVDDLARDLGKRDGGAGFPWSSILESVTESIIQAVRVGPPLETYAGELRRPRGIRWVCEGLVMADVPNGWTAAGSTGKSTFAAALALSHAAGIPFLDRETVQGVPLYLDWESTGDDLEEKLWLLARWYDLRSVPAVHRLKMGGAAVQHAAAIANRIDSLGATLVVWDGMQAACGPLGQSGSYEALAQDMEFLIGILPLTTHLFLDHVTGDELKSGAVPLKPRGATRKIEWLRNHWTLSLDRDAQRLGQHLVGWTHTKINRAAYLPPFGVEVLHRPDEMGFRIVQEADVEPLRERMPPWRQLLTVAIEALPRTLSNRDAAELWLGKTDDKSIDRVRAIVNRDHGRNFRKYTDGTFGPSTRWAEGAARTSTDRTNGPHPHLRPVDDEPEELPF